MRIIILEAVLAFLYHVNADVAVLILARGGSKGVKLKNLQKVGRVSLLQRAIQTAKAAGLHDITVSTDHPLIALQAIKENASVFHRSPVTATDWAPSIWGAAEFIESRPNINILVLMQATSPFTKPFQLKKAVEEIEGSIKFDCVFSVTKCHKFRWTRLSTTNAYLPVNVNINNRVRRQDWEGDFLETGAFYVSRRRLIESGRFQNHK